jgi:hypothetical protein
MCTAHTKPILRLSSSAKKKRAVLTKSMTVDSTIPEVSCSTLSVPWQIVPVKIAQRKSNAMSALCSEKDMRPAGANVLINSNTLHQSYTKLEFVLWLVWRELRKRRQMGTI